MYFSMEVACDCMGKQGQSWGGLGGRVKDGESEDRVEAWSVLVLAEFSKDHSSCRCRSQDVTRYRQRWRLGGSSVTCARSAGPVSSVFLSRKGQ